MPRDQFARVNPGDKLAGLPSQPWNRMLDLVRPGPFGGLGPGVRGWTSVEVPVLNTTGSALDQFGILQINAPLNEHATAPNAFFAEDTLTGTTPAADKPFVVFQEPVAANGVARARYLGLTKCLVNVTDANHEYAAPTTATNKLTSGSTGPARIIHKPSGTGDKQCVVGLHGASAAGAVEIFADDYTQAFSGGVVTGTTTLAGPGTLGVWPVGTYYVTIYAKAEGYLGSSVTRLLAGTVSVASGTAGIYGGTLFGGANTASYVFVSAATAGGSDVHYSALEGNAHFKLEVTADATIQIAWTIANGPNFTMSGWVFAIKAG